mgnify:CR=1 FL=1
MKRRFCQAGISTMENLVAVALFGIAAAGLGAMAIGTTAQTTRSKIATAAAALVEEQVERLRALDPATKPWQLQPGTYNDPANPLTASGVNGGKFLRSWSVAANTPTSGLARVVVTVTFQGPASYTATGVTYVCTTATCS